MYTVKPAHTLSLVEQRADIPQAIKSAPSEMNNCIMCVIDITIETRNQSIHGWNEVGRNGVLSPGLVQKH